MRRDFYDPARYQGVVPGDFTVAVEWYSSAAEQEHVEAQVRLGQAYDEGNGVRYDPGRAYMWYHIAAAAGDSEAAMRIDEFSKRLRAYREKGLKLAEECVRRNYKGC